MNTHANVNYLKRFLHYLFFSMITLIVLAGGAQAAIQCYECHGTKSPVDYRPVDAPYRNMTTGGFLGNHRNHMDSTADPDTCTKCHNNAGYTTNHRDGRIQFSANINSSPATGQYNVSGSPVTFKNQTSLPIHGSCSNANCHFEALTPAWGSSALGAPDTTTCATCHNALPASNAHTKHITKYGNDLTACNRCHPDHAVEGNPFQHATSAGRNIAVNAGNYAGSNYNYLPSQAGTRTVGTCSNFYCHSDGTRASAPFTANQDPSWADVGNITCKSCHGGPTALGSNILASGKHTVHMNNSGVIGDNLGCVECHSKTVTNDSTIGTPANHANAFRDYSGVKAGGSGSYVTGTGVCSSTYCHTDGKGTQKSMAADNWKAATTLDCKGCHGSDAAPAFASVAGEPNYANAGAGAAKANSHQKHAAAGASTCTNCHSKTTTNGTAIIAGSQHLNKLVNYTSNVPAGKTYGKLANKTCSNISCHSGNGIVASVADAQWGATLNCNGCHGDASTLASGTHNSHLALSGVTCNYCHNATASDNTTISTPANHANASITINFNASAAPAGGTYNGQIAGGATVYQKTGGLPVGACATSVCHGFSSPTWGNNTGNNTCTKCHGTGTVTVNADNRYVVAPPTSIAGTAGAATGTGQVSNDPKVGAHQTHLRFLNGFSNYSSYDFRCENCHGTLPISGTHANGSSTPAFQGMATNRGAMTPTWTAASLTCNNTYCHNPSGSGGILNTSNVGSRTFVSWTSASYLGDTAKTQTNCGRCHKSPGDAGFTSTTDHSAYTVATTDCSGCHGHNGDTAGTVGQRHMDGKKFGSGDCNSCHDYDTVGATYAGGTWTGGTWGILPYRDGLSPGEGWGAHAKHINYIKTRLSIATALDPANQTFGVGNSANVCGTCHTNNDANHTTGGSTVRSINFGESLFKMGGAGGTSLLFGSTNPVYNGTSGISSASIPKTCSNLSCHYFTTPIWSSY